MHQILIADDHPLFIDAVTVILKIKFPEVSIFACNDLESALEIAEQKPDLDVILLDINMPGMDGLNGIVRLRNKYPEIPIVIVSAEQDKSTVLQAITYGAVGFITKTSCSEQVSSALEQIMAGQVYLPPDVIRSSSESTSKDSNPVLLDPKTIASLTQRQLLVFERMSKGESNKQIAYELNIAETTVKAHVSAVLHKLKVHNRIQAVLCAASIDFNQLLHR